MTREYPPQVYGGAGVHVEYLAQAMARLAEVEVKCFGERGDEMARAIFEQQAMALGRLFTIAANFVDPDVYLLGGGVIETVPAAIPAFFRRRATPRLMVSSCASSAAAQTASASGCDSKASAETAAAKTASAEGCDSAAAGLRGFLARHADAAGVPCRAKSG